MRWSRFVVVCTCLALIVAGISTMSAQKKMKEPVVWPADNIKWMDVKEAPGVMYADLWGHMDKGAYGAFVKFPAGTKHPLHSHTNDIKAIVISGTFWVTPEGGKEQRLPAGSYFFVPGGSKHMSGSTDDGPCEIFQESPGKFDMMPAEEKK